MVLMIVITGMVFSLLRGTLFTANANYEMTDATQGVRNSQEFITRDVLSAGDGLRGLANIWIPTAFATRFLTARNASAIDASNRGYVSLGAVVSDNNVPAGTAIAGSDPASNVKERSDRLTVLAVDPNFTARSLPAGWTDFATGAVWIPGGDLSEFNVGEVYFISDGVNATFGMITRKDEADWALYWEAGDPLGLNRTGNTGGLAAATNRNANPTTLSRVQMIQFFVDAGGKLIRRVFGVKNAPYADSVIAEHVFNLQFRYILKPSGNGTLIFDQPKDQLEIGDHTRVRMIEPWVIVETAYPLQNGEKEQTDGRTRIAVRNVQFNEAMIPRDSQGNTTLPNTGPTPYVTPTSSPTPLPLTMPSSTPTPAPTPTPTRTPTPSPTPR